MKKIFINYKNKDENKYKIDSIIFKCDFSVFSRNEYILNQTKQTLAFNKLKKFLFRNMLIVSMFLFACLLPCACTNKASNDISVEQESPVEDTTEVVEVPIEEDVVVEVEEPIEEVEEINPRDMKAVYGLDFDVPIYTDEEVEQAKEYLCTTDIDYNPDIGLSEEQYENLGNSYYVANQDTLYELYSCTKDFDFKAWKEKFTVVKYYYDEEHDIVIRADQYNLELVSKDFDYIKTMSEKSHEPATIKNGMLVVGPGAVISIGAEYGACDYLYNEYTNYIDESNDISELEKYGFRLSEKELNVVTTINKGSYTSEQ